MFRRLLKKNLKMEYNKIIITNLPSFYKINLYNRINRQVKIFVIFTGDTAEIRNMDFFIGNIEFEYENLQGLSRIKKLTRTYELVKSNAYTELVICGINELTSWMLAFCFPKKKNSTVVESSYYESIVVGIKGWLKKLFFSRISVTYASGKAQDKLVHLLNFKGKVIITKGVGIFNIKPQPPYTPVPLVKNFIYVGRLSPEKNLQFLIETFNQLPELTLNIIGYGPQEIFLKSLAKSNIVFYGAIPNSELHDIYQKNDVFVLPSLSETWGLVVEEAFNNGLPVIVSDKVGCAEEIVNESNGLIFKLSEHESLLNAVLKMRDIEFYNLLCQNISKMDFNKIADEQVNCYL